MVQRTRVMVLGTLHQHHKTNPHYSYEDIFTLVDKSQADVVAVEIRPEDLDQPLEYLRGNYPYEMVEAVRRYREAKVVAGFDWLGHELHGRPIPEGYWRGSMIKRLERDFEASPSYQLARELLAVCDKARSEIIMSEPSAAKLNDGCYDIASSIYYQQFGILVRGTVFEELSRFYDERDAQIAENILDIVAHHLGQRLAILIGCDHRAKTLSVLRERYSDTIELVAVPSLERLV